MGNETDKEQSSAETEPPAPPHPVERRQPLPGEQPKSARDDSGAPDIIKKILESPSYREAAEDPDFLHAPQTRGIRLQLEYLKAEMLLAEHRVGQSALADRDQFACADRVGA